MKYTFQQPPPNPLNIIKTHNTPYHYCQHYYCTLTSLERTSVPIMLSNIVSNIKKTLTNKEV